jgi:hypothetical protein
MVVVAVLGLLPAPSRNPVPKPGNVSAHPSDSPGSANLVRRIVADSPNCVGRGQRCWDLDLGSLRLCGHFHVINGSMRLRYRFSHFPHGLEVSNQSILKVPARLFLAVTNGHASQHIRRIGGIASPCLFDDYGISSRDHFSPAFLSITFSVPGASSLPSFPGTVITNASSGCLKCRWLPLDRISSHPCFSSKRITSRTFIGISLMVRHRGGRATA